MASKELESILIRAFKEEDGTLEELAERHGTTYKVLWRVVQNNFSKEERLQRKSRTYSKSKLGKNNPMSGKYAEQHHNFKGEVSDCKGYLLHLKPAWYTGRTKSKHIYYHHLVLCAALGLTEIPSGWSVHHIDKNPLNNDITNLALITRKGHSKLHAMERFGV